MQSPTDVGTALAGALYKCGRTAGWLAVAVVQKPAADLMLPYSSSWTVEVTVAEHWNSTRDGRSNLRLGSTGSDRVSILPLSQWQPTRLHMRARIMSKKAVFDRTLTSRRLCCGHTVVGVDVTGHSHPMPPTDSHFQAIVAAAVACKTSCARFNTVVFSVDLCVCRPR